MNGEIKRRTDVVGIFPNEAAIVRWIGAVPFEQNDKRAIRHRYMQVEAFSKIDAGDVDPILGIKTEAILAERRRIKDETIRQRRLLDQSRAA